MDLVVMSAQKGARIGTPRFEGGSFGRFTFVGFFVSVHLNRMHLWNSTNRTCIQP